MAPRDIVSVPTEAPNDDFCERLYERAADVERLISARRLPTHPWRDPEYRRNLDRLYLALHDACRLHQVGRLDDPAAEREVLKLLNFDAKTLNGEALGERME